MKSLFALTCLIILVSSDTVQADKPAQPKAFQHAGVVQAWKMYGKELTFGKGQTLALVDDGCRLSMPE